MTKEYIVETFFVNIVRIRDDILAINEIFTDKELVITTILGFPPSWGAFSSSLNSWKVALTFEELWTACSQEELMISMVSNPEEYQMLMLLIINERDRRDRGRNLTCPR